MLGKCALKTQAFDVVVVVYWETLTRLVIRDRHVETTGLRSVPPGFSKSGKRPRRILPTKSDQCKTRRSLRGVNKSKPAFSLIMVS